MCCDTKDTSSRQLANIRQVPEQSPKPSPSMALDLPLPILLVLLSAPQALLVKALIPEQSLRIPITPIVLGLIGMNFGVWVFYRIALYPFFFSPFRHLPSPKEVSFDWTCFASGADFSRADIPSLTMVWLS
ncbi:hypothetical protein BKA80DRAFT_271339 [Phyllosticta citrichinensis]